MNQTNKEDKLDQTLIKLVQEKKPSNVQELIDLTKSDIMFVTEQEIMKHILQLQNQGKLKLKEPLLRTPPKLGTYLKTTEATWYWIIIILTTTALTVVLTIQEKSNQLIYIRNILGVIFILFLPGYSLIKLLFPNKELNIIERTALSIGMSLALVPLTGLILYYTQWGITTIPVTLSLLALTTIFATAAIIREYQHKILNQELKPPS